MGSSPSVSCKLGFEGPRVAYAIAFSHGPKFKGAHDLLKSAGAGYSGDLRLALIARDGAFTRGAWLVTDFPRHNRLAL